MKTFSYTITDEVGIHARPAGLLAKKAKEFESVCTIEKGGKSVNITKLLLWVLALSRAILLLLPARAQTRTRLPRHLRHFLRKLCKISFVSWAVEAVQPAGRFCGVFAGASHRLEKA